MVPRPQKKTTTTRANYAQGGPAEARAVMDNVREREREYVIRLIVVPVLFYGLTSDLCFVLVLTTLTKMSRKSAAPQISSSSCRSVLMTSKPG